MKLLLPKKTQAALECFGGRTLTLLSPHRPSSKVTEDSIYSPPLLPHQLHQWSTLRDQQRSSLRWACPSEGLQNKPSTVVSKAEKRDGSVYTVDLWLGETCCRCCCYFWLAVFSSSPFLSSMLGCLPVFVSFSHMKVTKVHKSKHHYKRLRQSTALSPAFFLQKPLMKIGPTSTSYSKRSATNLQHFHPPQQESRGLSVRLYPLPEGSSTILSSAQFLWLSHQEKRPFQKYGMKNLGNSESLPRY